MTAIIALVKLLLEYLTQPGPLFLTFLVPAALFFTCRKYVWVSLPLAAAVELILQWSDFCYYESRGLAILFVSAQITVTGIVILILRGIVPRKKE